MEGVGGDGGNGRMTHQWPCAGLGCPVSPIPDGHVAPDVLTYGR
jgi:hypothetical protein